MEENFEQNVQKQLLIIENTYTNKQICIDKIFEKDFSTKPHNTGLGLWEVKKILSKNNLGYSFFIAIKFKSPNLKILENLRFYI